MSGDIYQQDIKALAFAAHGAVRFSAAEKASGAVVTLDNPLCGDRVALRVERQGDRIVAVTHEVRGCLLCRAAASVIGHAAAGSDGSDIRQVASGLATMLANGGNLPEGWPGNRWQELALFVPVAGHRSRHGCVLLPFEALSQAYGAACSTTLQK